MSEPLFSPPILAEKVIIPGDSARLSQCYIGRPPLSSCEDPTTGVLCVGKQQVPLQPSASSSPQPALCPQVHGTSDNSYLHSSLPFTIHLSHAFVDFSQPHQINIFIPSSWMRKLRLKLAPNHITSLWQSQNLNQDMLPTKPTCLSTVWDISNNKLIRHHSGRHNCTLSFFLFFFFGRWEKWGHIFGTKPPQGGCVGVKVWPGAYLFIIHKSRIRWVLAQPTPSCRVHGRRQR